MGLRLSSIRVEEVLMFRRSVVVFILLRELCDLGTVRSRAVLLSRYGKGISDPSSRWTEKTAVNTLAVDRKSGSFRTFLSCSLF